LTTLGAKTTNAEGYPTKTAFGQRVPWPAWDVAVCALDPEVAGSNPAPLLRRQLPKARTYGPGPSVVSGLQG